MIPAILVLLTPITPVGHNGLNWIGAGLTLAFGLVVAGVIFVVFYLVNLVRAPYLQRNEARALYGNAKEDVNKMGQKIQELEPRTIEQIKACLHIHSIEWSWQLGRNNPSVNGILNIFSASISAIYINASHGSMSVAGEPCENDITTSTSQSLFPRQMNRVSIHQALSDRTALKLSEAQQKQEEVCFGLTGCHLGIEATDPNGRSITLPDWYIEWSTPLKVIPGTPKSYNL